MPESTPSARIEKIRRYIVWWCEKPKEPVELFAVGMLIAGVNPFDFLRYLPKFISEFLSNSSKELIFSAVTILIIDVLNERRRKRAEIEELTLQMGSPNNTIAVEAVRKWKRYKFQERQDRIGKLPSEEYEQFSDDEPIWLPSLQGLWLEKANLSKADLTWLDLSKARLGSAELVKANLSQSCLRSTRLDRANLYHAILSETDLTGACLREAKLTKANLSNATLNKADLSEANLGSANLQGATFKLTKLFSANLSKADLRRATFTRADLFNANLAETDLRGAAFTQQTDLSGANLGGAQIGPPRSGFAPPTGWGDQTSFSGAIYNDETIWPDNVNPSEYGAKKESSL